MKKSVLGTIQKSVALVVSMGMLSAALTGCQYDSVEDYLKTLGILDPNDYQDAEVSDAPVEMESIEPAFVISEDLSVSGASTEDDTQELQEESTSLTTQEETVVDESEMADASFMSSYSEITKSATSDMIAAREAIGLNDTSIANLKKQQEGLYAYDRLTSSGKTLYVEILTILTKEGKDILVSTTSDEAVELVFDFVMADHPEIFYVDGYNYTNYTMDNVITKISFTGSYTYDLQEVERRQQEINSYVNQCLAGAPSSDDDYYVIKYVYDYIINNTEYDLDAPDNQNICSVFIGGRSVCNGYAKAAQYLLNKLGIKCTLVTGTVNNSGASNVRHAWNLVECNDAYYYMDVTWGDASYQTASGETADASKLPDVNYAYLNVTTSEILLNHKLSDRIELPYCSSSVDNYYVREGEYFTSAELTPIKELFDRKYNEGSDNVTIKCSSQAVYDAIFEEMVTNRKVFDYLQGDTSQVAYTSFEETRTIIFWL